MGEQFIQHCLSDYVRLILLFEQTLTQRYQLTDNPYSCQNSFQRRGVLIGETSDFEYRFHGKGCSFNYQGFEVHYGYYITLKDYITTSPWSFWRFVVSRSRESNLLDEPTLEDVFSNLEALCKYGIVEKPNPDFFEYQISFSWFKSFDSSA
jgi:hypothetical protein